MRDGFGQPVSPGHILFLFLAIVRVASQMGSNLAPVPSESSTCLSPDICTLLKFKNQLVNEGEPALQSWTSENRTEWFGVTWIVGSDDVLHVEKLELSGLSLDGSLYPLLEEGLTSLSTLNISGCNITSQLPPTLRVCPSLEVLDLSNNVLSGPLPSSFSCENASSPGLSSPLLNLRIFNLSENFLTGVIPISLISSLATAGNLTSLSLSNNYFVGSIPAALGNCTSLVELELASNNLTGYIPFTELGKLLHLRTLDLHTNFLSWSLFAPSDSIIFPSLTFLNVSNNTLGGGIPEWVGNISQLLSLDLSCCNVNGPIPDSVGNLSNLLFLGLHMNNLTGVIPDSLSKLSKLQNLKLFSNSLVGPIPDNLSTNLRTLELSANNLTGSIPDYLGNLLDLEVLDLSSNVLTGIIPASLGYLSNLTTLDLHSNNLSGPIPDSVGNLSHLNILSLQKNTNLEGPIPTSILRLVGLTQLNLGYNKLNGSISLLTQLNQLQLLRLEENRFTGGISENFSNFANLQSLWLGKNNLAGPIPPQLGILSNLVVLSLTDCRISGTIPPELMKLTQLGALDLSYNKLTGNVPSSVCDLSRLQLLLLNNNQFSGSVPSCIGNFTELKFLDMSVNQLTGVIPSDLSNLSSSPGKTPEELYASTINNFLGNLVYDVSQYPISFYLMNNSLTGEIPPALGDIKQLQQLNLSFNKLSGDIPDALGGAQNLFSLDLSFNDLNGSIPVSLTGLTFLSTLNLSYNNLSGQIPHGQQFNTFTNLSFLGNPGLCGLQGLRVCEATTTATAPAPLSVLSETFRRPMAKKLLPLYIILASLVVCCCFLAGLYFWSSIWRCSGINGSPVSNDGDSYESKEDLQFFHVTISSALPSINPKVLALATDYYDVNNIIGDGGFGLVYKAVLNNGAVVAVKKLVEDGVQGQSEFLAEMRTLGKIKHPNLVSLLGYCAYGKERILVYEYMKNGSLDTWLHCRDDGVPSLDWRTRLKIVRGAAEGLAFLHHDSIPTIIHRDIKASNILLDCDFEARLADFGLARSTRAFESHVSTDFAGTAGYIPPEYSQAGPATTKGDVYSFGVVLLEILTGRRPTDPFFRKKDMSHVVPWVLNVSLEEAIEKTMDMSYSASTDEMLELMRIACKCCHEVPTRRPNMKEVVKLLDTLEKQHSPSRSPSVVLYEEAMSSPTCR